MYSIIFSRKSLKTLSKMSKKDRERIISALERIKIRPLVFLERLAGDPCYKFRAGNYRALIDLDQGRLIILVIKIGHRKNVYHKG